MGGLLESGMSLQQSFEALIDQEEHKGLQYIGKQMKDKIVHGESFSRSLFLLDILRELFPYSLSTEKIVVI